MSLFTKAHFSMPVILLNRVLFGIDDLLQPIIIIFWGIEIDLFNKVIQIRNNTSKWLDVITAEMPEILVYIQLRSLDFSIRRNVIFFLESEHVEIVELAQIQMTFF